MQKCLICGKKAKYYLKEINIFGIAKNKFFLCSDCIEIKWDKKGKRKDE